MGWFGQANSGTFWMISRPPELRLSYRLLRWDRVAQQDVLNTMNPIFENIFFHLKGGRVNFWMKMLIPKTHFLKILTSFLGSIYTLTLIFPRNIILSVKMELSPRPTSGLCPPCGSTATSGEKGQKWSLCLNWTPCIQGLKISRIFLGPSDRDSTLNI